MSSTTFKSWIKIFSIVLLFQFLSAESNKCQFTIEGTFCSNGDIGEVIENINQFLQTNSTNRPRGEFKLSQIHFENNQIQNGWLDDLKLQFSSLVIDNSFLSEIGPGSFSGENFQFLTALHLNHTNITTLRKNIFEGTQLSTFRIDCDFFLDPFEDNIFEPVSQTLQMLQIRSCIQTESLSKINSLKSLLILDIQHNSFLKLDATSFADEPYLIVMNLTDSDIFTIEEDTFQGLFLDALDISYNQLSTLPEKVLQNVRRGIDISGNNWKCDCDLVWLRDLFVNYPGRFASKSKFYCRTSSGDVIFSEVDFCPSSKEIK